MVGVGGVSERFYEGGKIVSRIFQEFGDRPYRRDRGNLEMKGIHFKALLHSIRAGAEAWGRSLIFVAHFAKCQALCKEVYMCYLF